MASVTGQGLQHWAHSSRQVPVGRGQGVPCPRARAATARLFSPDAARGSMAWRCLASGWPCLPRTHTGTAVSPGARAVAQSGTVGPLCILTPDARSRTPNPKRAPNGIKFSRGGGGGAGDQRYLERLHGPSPRHIPRAIFVFSSSSLQPQHLTWRIKCKAAVCHAAAVWAWHES